MTRILTQSWYALVIVALLSQVLRADDTEAERATNAAAAQPAATSTEAEEAKADAESAADTAATDAAAEPDEPAKTHDSVPDDEKAKADHTAPQVAAQESDSTDDSATPAETPTIEELAPWQELHQQWLAVDQRLSDAEYQYYGLMTQQDPATKERRNQLRFEFEDLIKNEANPLLKKLRAEVIKAYKAAPNDDVQLVRLLVGYMVNHARMQEKADAEEIVELLIENKADARYVLVDARASRLRPTSAEMLEKLQNRYKEAISPTNPNGDDSTSASGGDIKLDDGTTEASPEHGGKTADSAKTND